MKKLNSSSASYIQLSSTTLSKGIISLFRAFMLLIMGCATLNSYSQSNCHIKDDYKTIFSIKKKTYNNDVYLSKTINKIDTSSCFSDLVNNNSVYLNYLLMHFSKNATTESLMNITDSVKLQETFIEHLENDSLFNDVMCRLNLKLSGSTDFVADTFCMNDLLNIAVKFFSIIKINDDGNYIGKVCSEINGIEQTESQRLPHLEAFCFTSILTNYQSHEFNMYEEFVCGIKELNTINLGVVTDDKLLRAQGAMYMFMKNNKRLRELLLSEFNIRKAYLPFVLQ